MSKYDLNVPWPVLGYGKASPVQIASLKATISTAFALDYTHIAINFTVPEGTRLPVHDAASINPIPMAALSKHFEKSFPKARLFSRLTLMVADPAQIQGLAKIQNHFDILAVQPTTEKALQLAVSNLDIDIVSLNLSQRLPFYLKHKTVCSGVDRGVHFEISYATLIGGPAGYTNNGSEMVLSTTALAARKNFFSNALQLIRASRSRGLVVSSGATHPLQLRNSSDILTVLKTIGLESGRTKHCVTTSPERALVSGRLRIKSYKQTVIAGNEEERDVLWNNESEDPQKKLDSTGYKKRAAEAAGGLLKKHRKKA